MSVQLPLKVKLDMLLSLTKIPLLLTEKLSLKQWRSFQWHQRN